MRRRGQSALWLRSAGEAAVRYRSSIEVSSQFWCDRQLSVHLPSQTHGAVDVPRVSRPGLAYPVVVRLLAHLGSGPHTPRTSALRTHTPDDGQSPQTPKPRCSPPCTVQTHLLRGHRTECGRTLTHTRTVSKRSCLPWLARPCNQVRPCAHLYPQPCTAVGTSFVVGVPASHEATTRRCEPFSGLRHQRPNASAIAQFRRKGKATPGLTCQRHNVWPSSTQHHTRRSASARARNRPGRTVPSARRAPKLGSGE